jgi:hypothetical protein
MYKVARHSLKIAMISVSAGPFLGCFWCAWDKRRVQMSPATLHMSSMDPQQTDTVEFQQIQSIESMEEARRCLKIAIISV